MGRNDGYTLKADVEDYLVQSIFLENTTSYMSVALAVEMQLRNMEGLTSYFCQKSERHKQFAWNFIVYMTSRGANVKLLSLAEQNRTWGTYEQCFLYMYNQEQALLNWYEQGIAFLQSLGDFSTSVIVQEQLKKSIKERSESERYLDYFRLAKEKSESILILNKQIQKESTKNGK